MNYKHLTLASVLATTLITSGCATLALPLVANAAAPRAAESSEAGTDKKRVAKSAGIGCAVGVGLAVLMGKKDDALKGCAAGAIAGGVASWRKQVNEAREVEQAARDAGMTAQVRTVQEQDESGKQGEKLQALVIEYDAADMQALSPKTEATLDRLAKLLRGAKNRLIVRFEGATACTVPLQALEQRDALASHDVVNACGKGPNRITVSPLPDLR